MKYVLFFLLTALAASALPSRAGAQVLIVPLNGKRVHDIQAAQLFHTLFNDFFLEDDATTYVQTGDIPAMWLRDSSAQTIPYVRFQTAFPILRSRFAGVIERNARNIVTDPYANAFQADYHVWERKWEVDSLAWPMVLTWTYWHVTHDRTVFTPVLHVAMRKIVATYSCEQNHRRCSRYDYPYYVRTDSAYAAGTGMIWGAFRPSDDAVEFRFNIPQNALAVVALHEIADLATIGYGDRDVADKARALAAQVEVGILRYGRFYDVKRRAWSYAYETDGFGRYNLMDDANLPNLTTLPYLDWCSIYDPTYRSTREFVLSKHNPYYYSGRYAAGLGSPHTPANFVWPLGIIGRALTARSPAQVAEAIATLAVTDGESGTIHESFYADGYWRYTRDEFGWANALGAELLFRSVAGYPSTQFLPDGPILPFQPRTQTPSLALPFTQAENAAKVLAALGRLLHVEGPIPHGH
ncbi:MAG TPA: glycoside hydrolase family 125 protein [Candidatus Tumulicola sp.]|nr:glycoside hydrolase family 125 protein [Candidatus Tumulicola sp.]